MGGGAGLLAALFFPVLLDLDFGFGAGTDAALSVPFGDFFVINLFAASLFSGGRWANGGFVGIDGSARISGGGGDGAFAGMLFRCDADMLRKNFPICSR